MNWIKIIFIFLFFGTQKACSICTEEQSAKMASCTVEFIKSLGLQEKENHVDMVSKFMSSSSEIDTLCEKYEVTKECMGPEVIENCNKLKTDMTSIESAGDNMEVAFIFLNMGGQYVCEVYNSEIKGLYTCALSRCLIDSSSCETIQSTIDECVEESQGLCPPRVFPFLKPVLKARECLKMPECEFCDPRIVEKLKQYTNKKGKSQSVHKFINGIKLVHGKESNFDDIQISYIVGFLEQKDKELRQGALALLMRIATRGTSKQKKLMVDLNIVPTLCKLLNEKDYTKGDREQESWRDTQFMLIYYFHNEDPGVMEQFVENGGEEILKEFINAKDDDIKLIANSFSKQLEKHFEERSCNRNFKSKVEDGSIEFFDGISSADDGTQLWTLKEYRKQLARGKISTNAGVERGIIPYLGKLLSTKKGVVSIKRGSCRSESTKNAINFWSFFKLYKLLVQIFQHRYAALSDVDDLGGDAVSWQIIPHAEIQAESAKILKYFVTDHLNAMVEEDVIPALIRTLVSTDAKVLRHSIETLTLIIEQQPKLRNLFMESHILEPLLMSYSDGSDKKMIINIGTILGHLFQQKIPETHMLVLVPAISELIYSYDSETLMELIPTLFMEEDTGEFIKRVYSFLKNNKKLNRESTKKLMMNS